MKNMKIKKKEKKQTKTKRQKEKEKKMERTVKRWGADELLDKKRQMEMGSR